MRERRVSLALAAVVAASLAVAAVMAAGSSGRGAAGALPLAKAGGEMPAALDRHLDQLAKTIPGNGGEPGGESPAAEGKGSAGMQAFIELAYPKKDVPLSSILAARQAFKAAVQRGPGRGNREWKQVGPETATYQFTPLRGRFVLCPERVRGRRPHDRPGDRSRLRRARPREPRLPDVDHACGRRRLAHRERACEQREVEVPLGQLRHQLDRLDHDRPERPDSNTLWVGTGEGNTCGSGCVAGVGLYKSTDGGDHWAGPYGTSAFNARGVGTIAVKPGNSNVIYAGSSYGVRGHASSCCYGAVSQYRALIPGAPQWGLYRSTNGGSTWTLVHNGSTSPSDCGTDILLIANNATPCSPRGVRRIEIDPSDPNIVYAASYARGVWRSSDGGTTWTEIKPSLNATIATTRPDIAVTRLPNGKTRMYVGEGHTSTAEFSRLYRSDDVATGVPVFNQLTSNDPSTPAWHSFNFCTGQCWYDNFVYTPPGGPDIIYLGGSYQYGENVANHRAVLLSTDAGETFTDMTYDGTDTVHPNGIHPDEHRLVTNPRDPMQFFEASDGGLMRSDGRFVNRSSDCDSRGLAEPYLSRCHELLSRIPRELEP